MHYASITAAHGHIARKFICLSFTRRLGQRMQAWFSFYPNRHRAGPRLRPLPLFIWVNPQGQVYVSNLCLLREGQDMLDALGIVDEHLQISWEGAVQ
jgi:hypothetical protein